MRKTIWACIALAAAFAVRTQIKTATAHQIHSPDEFDSFTVDKVDTTDATAFEALPSASPNTVHDQSTATSDLPQVAVRIHDTPKDSETVAVIQEQLLEDPHDETLLMRLESMAIREPDLRPGILNFVQGLADESGAAVIQESLARLHTQNRDWQESIAALDKASPWTNRPMAIGAEGILARLQLGRWRDAIRKSQELEGAFAEWWSGRRDESLIQDRMEPEILGMICFLRAIALVKLNQIQDAEKTLSTCGEGILDPTSKKAIQTRLAKNEPSDWIQKSLDEILD